MYWDDKYGTHSVSSEVCFAQSFNFNFLLLIYYVNSCKYIHETILYMHIYIGYWKHEGKDVRRSKYPNWKLVLIG
jgi:hypothetical protein